MAAACAGALFAMGYEVDYYGVLPTPALAYQAMLDSVPAIMVTGSHIPFDRNGLKFYRPDGEISKDDENKIISLNDYLISFSPNLPPTSLQACQNYIKRYLNFFPEGFLSGKNIGIYEHSSAGRDLYKIVFEKLGAVVTSLERTDNFVPIDTEAVSEADQAKGLSWSKKYSFDAIFSTDGDGDRPLIADEMGRWLRGDIVGLLCAKALGIKELAIPVSCNTAVEQSGFFSKVIRTKIGSPYVIAAFSSLNNAVAGFEANGGFLLATDIHSSSASLTALPTRDALLPALALLSLTGKNPLSELVASLPQRFTCSDRLQNVSNTLSSVFIETALSEPQQLMIDLGLSEKMIVNLDQTDGLRFTFVDGDILHFRPSGNAPELRVYVESISIEGSLVLLNTALKGCTKLLKDVTVK